MLHRTNTIPLGWYNVLSLFILIPINGKVPGNTLSFQSLKYYWPDMIESSRTMNLIGKAITLIGIISRMNVRGSTIRYHIRNDFQDGLIYCS